MDWIKNNVEKVILGILALVLLISSVLLILKAAGYSKTFGDLTAAAPKTPTVDPVDTDKLVNAKEMLKDPLTWERPHNLFVSNPYVVKDGNLVEIGADSSMNIHEGVPNKWFLDNDLDILDTSILRRDADDDGFTNFEEWQGKTDPQDPEKHPPFYTKLRLQEFIQKQFRLLFASYSGDTFQINTIDLDQPSQFLKLGDKVDGTQYEIVKFEERFIDNPETGGQKDVSELVLRQTESGKEITLPIGKRVDDPNTLAIFLNLVSDETFEVKKGEDFVLNIEPEVGYKLIDVNPQEATIIQNNTGKEIVIPKIKGNQE